MTFVPHTKNKRCFTACPEHKIKSGLCDCINRMKFKGNDNIDAVISTVCDCEKKAYEPLISGEVKCLRCGKMIAQTDL